MTRTARIGLVLAVLNLLAHWAAIGWTTVRFPGMVTANLPHLIAIAAPPALTFAAALLAWGDRTPVRLAVAIGNGVLLFKGLLLLDRASGLKLLASNAGLEQYLANGYVGVPLAVVLLPPAVSVWWQRRPADPD